MNQSKIKLYIDLFFCCVFLPLIIALVPVEKWIVKYPSFAVTLVLFLYAAYFAIRVMNIPQKVMQRKYVHIVVFCIAITGITYFISQFPYPPDIEPIVTSHPNLHEHLRAQTVWFMFLVVSGYSLSISLLLELFRQIIVKKELAEGKKNAELALYKAQINPHFFFNTMNTLYGLVISKSDKAENAFIRFTSLLKYTYSQTNTDRIAIKSEIDYIQNYIELQRLRLNRHTVVKYDVSIDNETLTIPPMLLISFVENAFKYGTSSKLDCEIRIGIYLSDGTLLFECENEIVRLKKDDDTHIGIENTRSRLELMYPGRYDLSVTESDTKYRVTLQIEAV